MNDTSVVDLFRCKPGLTDINHAVCSETGTADESEETDIVR